MFVDRRPRPQVLLAVATVIAAAVATVIPAGNAGAATKNLIANPSAERIAGVKPSSWLQIASGSNARSFRVVSSGAADGRRFVRTQVTSRRTGYAGWSPAPVRVLGGGSYTYGDSYRSGVTTTLRARYLDAAGRVTYRYFTPAASSSRWRRAGITFTVPRGTVRLSMERLLTSPGTLDLDATLLRLRTAPAPAAPAPVPLPDPVPSPRPGPQPTPSPTPTPTPTPPPAPVPQPGSRALVSITFDDGLLSQFDNARPVLAGNGIPATFYIVSGYVGSGLFMNVDQIRSLQGNGHEIGGHSASHAHLTALSPEQRTAELAGSKATLEGWFGPIRSLAYPFGEYNDAVAGQAAGLYQTARTTEGGLNHAGSIDRSRLRMRYVTSGTSTETVAGWMREAANANAWTILVYHSVVEGGDINSVTPGLFAAHMSAVKASGLRTLTVSDAYATVG